MRGEGKTERLIKDVKALLKSRGIKPMLSREGMLTQVAEQMGVAKPPVYADQLTLMRAYLQVYGVPLHARNAARLGYDFVPLANCSLARVIARETAAGRMNQWPSRIGNWRFWPDGRAEGCV